MIERRKMRTSQIGNMHVISHARTVGRRIIVAEHLEAGIDAQRGADARGNDVRLRVVPLPVPRLRPTAGGWVTLSKIQPNK